MVRAFAQQLAAVLLEVADERAAFHALTVSGSRITSDSRRVSHHLAISLEDQADRFVTIRARLFEGRSLCVRAWKFFDEADVPFGDATEHGG